LFFAVFFSEQLPNPCAAGSNPAGGTNLKWFANFEMHGVRFSDVEPVFGDPHAQEWEEHCIDGEQRHVIIGADTFGRILTVVYCYQQQNIRLLTR
jgi:uncharacterized DUF497 family protein